jgi:hypothetical protein
VRQRSHLFFALIEVPLQPLDRPLQLSHTLRAGRRIQRPAQRKQLSSWRHLLLARLDAHDLPLQLHHAPVLLPQVLVGPLELRASLPLARAATESFGARCRTCATVAFMSCMACAVLASTPLARSSCMRARALESGERRLPQRAPTHRFVRRQQLLQRIALLGQQLAALLRVGVPGHLDLSRQRTQSAQRVRAPHPRGSTRASSALARTSACALRASASRASTRCTAQSAIAPAAGRRRA